MALVARGSCFSRLITTRWWIHSDLMELLKLEETKVAFGRNFGLVRRYRFRRLGVIGTGLIYSSATLLSM
jgi:hypothetical protein